MKLRVRTSGIAIVAVFLIAVSATLYLRQPNGSSEDAVTTIAADSAYVGMSECSLCHARITSSYLKTAMGRSFGQVNPEADGDPFTQNNTHFWDVRDRTYEMTSQGDQLFMASFTTDGDGNRVRERRDEITHWLGSGAKMRGALSLQRNRYRLLHMAWYGPLDEWAPFAMREPGAPPDDWVGYNCLYCHASYPRNAIGARWVAEVDHFPEPQELGPIDCERCHGPGREHVERASEMDDIENIRAAIVNPARLPAERQLDVCAQCHLEPTTRFPIHRLVAPGKSPYSFRPGDRLEDHFFVFDYDDPAMHSDEDTDIVNQSYLMVQSACFQKSGGRMTCTSCHDPHRDPPREERVDYFRGKCLTCHSATDCTTPDVDPQVLARSDCVSCHMAPTYAIDAVRAVIHRHKIERRPHSNANTTLDERLAHTQRVYGSESSRGRLKLYFPHANVEGRTRDIALALGHLHNKMPAPSLAGQEETVRRLGFGDPETLRLLGQVHLTDRSFANARSLAREAIELLPNFSPATLDLAEIELRTGNPQRAATLFGEVLEENPLNLTAHQGLANSYVKLKDEARAYQAYQEWQRALDVYLDVDTATQVAYYLVQAGRKREAIGFLREMLRKSPDDRELQIALERLLGKSAQPDE
jgi:hypothetical protein